MKYLVMCEGPNEKAVMDILLEHHLLKFSEDDLLGLVTYHARQIATSAQVRTALNLYPGEIRILRIGDKQSDALQIPPGYQSKIVSVEKFCTKPELEMLLILSEELEQAYVKVKSKMRAKSFAKENITSACIAKASGPPLGCARSSGKSVRDEASVPTFMPMDSITSLYGWRTCR